MRGFAGTCNAQTCSRMAQTRPRRVGENGEVIPRDIVTLEVKAMTPVRRIAAAALVAALGLGFVGIGASPANASIDTSWGAKIRTPN
jgi:hypothetical protein